MLRAWGQISGKVWSKKPIKTQSLKLLNKQDCQVVKITRLLFLVIKSLTACVGINIIFPFSLKLTPMFWQLVNLRSNLNTFTGIIICLEFLSEIIALARHSSRHEQLPIRWIVKTRVKTRRWNIFQYCDNFHILPRHWLFHLSWQTNSDKGSWKIVTIWYNFPYQCFSNRNNSFQTNHDLN